MHPSICGDGASFRQGWDSWRARDPRLSAAAAEPPLFKPSCTLRLTVSPHPQIARVSDLVKSLVEGGVTDGSGEIRERAVRCLGLFCILDELVADVYLPLLITVANTDSEELSQTPFPHPLTLKPLCHKDVPSCLSI